MRKKLAIVLAAVLIMGVTGCQETEKTVVTEVAEQETAANDVAEDSEVEKTDSETAEDSEDAERVDEAETTEAAEGPSVTITTAEEERTLDDGTVILTVVCATPQVTIPGNEAAQNKIAETLKQAEADFYTSAEEQERDAREFFEEAPEAQENDMSFYQQLNYEAARVDNKVITLIKSNVTFTGGAHGYNDQSGVNYDAATGDILTLDNITDDRDALVACVRACIIEECDNGQYKEAAFPDYKEYVDSVIADDLWYFDEEGIVFIANAYMLGPYAAGTLTFSIPYDKADGLKAEYKK